jgi:ADP-heptose:LPS heptosyltransferase
MAKPALSRLLVIFPGALGDFLCFLPALRVLSQGQQVDLLARSEFVDLVPPAVKVRSLECYQIHRLFVPQSGKEAELLQFFAPYSAILSWMGSRQNTFIRELDAVSQGRARVFPFQPTPSRMHQIDYYLACVGGLSSVAGVPQIGLRPEAIAWAERFWQQHVLSGKPVMALAPGSGAQEKNWPEIFFRVVADWWRQRTSGAVVVVVGPVENERGESQALCPEAVVARHLNLGQLAALLARSDLYLGNDSGVSHLAAAVNVTSAVLFGPSNARQWAPRGKQVMVLNQHVECAPCTSLAMKNCAHRKCLTTLWPESVCKELDRLLGENLTLTRGGVGITVNAEVYFRNHLK